MRKTVGNIKRVGFISDEIHVGTIAFSASNREMGNKASWDEIGIGSSAAPHAFPNGTYKLASEYQYYDGKTVGHNLVFDSSNWNPELSIWFIDPDLILALKLVKEGNSWVCSRENYIEVIKEEQDSTDFRLISIRREWLLDYLSARRLNLRLSTYCQRVENFISADDSPFKENDSKEETRENAKYSLRVNSLNSIFGGEVAVFRMGHNDFDEEQDAPDLSQSTDENMYSDTSYINRPTLDGVRVGGEYWRGEWLDHNKFSPRIRGDKPTAYPSFITETDGTDIPSDQLNFEEVGRWLYFRTDVIPALVNNRGFSLKWHTEYTGSVICENDLKVHFGIKKSGNRTILHQTAV